MKYITMMGELFILTERNYKLLFQIGAAGQEFDLDKLGKSLGNVKNITDFSPEQFQEELEIYERGI